MYFQLDVKTDESTCPYRKTCHFIICITCRHTSKACDNASASNGRVCVKFTKQNLQDAVCP